jgi:hypothetical protein
MQKRIIFLTVGVLLIFSVGFINTSLAQSTAVNNNLNLQTVDCSKYSSSEEVLFCNYFNILVTLITNYLKILTSNNQTLPPISNQPTTPPQTTPIPTPNTPTSTLTVPVKLIDKTTYGSNGDAFIDFEIQGYQTNKQVNRWSLNYFCPKGVTLDSGKELLCDGNDSFKSFLNFYSANIYDVTTNNLILRAVAQNKNPYPTQISFNLFAYDANNRVLGSDSKVINLGAYNPSPRLSINKTNFYPNDTWELYLTGAPANQTVTICAIDNKGVQSCTPAKNLGLKETTDVFGNWSASGNWAKTMTAEQIQNILGNWTEWVQVGDKTSNKINFTLTNPSSSYLNTLNQLANIVTSLNSLINQIGSLR